MRPQVFVTALALTVPLVAAPMAHAQDEEQRRPRNAADPADHTEEEKAAPEQAAFGWSDDL